MRVFICLLFLFFACLYSPVFAGEPLVLKAGVTLDDLVPDAIFGTWRVRSQLLETDSKGLFKNNNVDVWNISRKNSVITLENPISGANASISIKEVEGNKVVFEKIGNYDNKLLYDTVELYLDDVNFRGQNYLKLDTKSEIDGHIMKSQKAKYSLYGEKLSGYNVFSEE